MLNIVFYVDKCPLFDGNSPYLGYLGGTESAIVYISEQLSLLGHNVYIFNDIPKNSTFKDVKYLNKSFFNSFSLNNNIDIVIFIRGFIKNTKAKIIAFWSEDDYDQAFPEEFVQKSLQGELVDLIITVSNYHTNNFINHFNLPYNKFYTTRNGINPSFFQKEVKKEKYRLIYTSMAFRGLEILLDIYPEILKRFPKTSLHIFSSLLSLDKEKYNIIYKKIVSNSSIKLHKPVLQPQLALEMKKSYVFSYPNTFPETSCISAIESQAAGTPVVTSELGALTETVKDNYSGFCIKGNPYSNEYKTLFLNKIFDLFSDDDLFNKISKNAQKRIFENFTWQIIAKEWDKKFYSLLEKYNIENNFYDSINYGSNNCDELWSSIKNLYKFNSLYYKRLNVLKKILEKINNQEIYNQVLEEICKISFYLEINDSDKYFCNVIELLKNKNINLGKVTELSFIYFIQKYINTNFNLSISYCKEGLKYLPNSYLLNLKFAEIILNKDEALAEKLLNNCFYLKKEYKNQDKHLLLLAYLSFKKGTPNINYLSSLNLYSKTIIKAIIQYIDSNTK